MQLIAMCCLLPEAALDDILEKFKWLYGSLESSDTLMQEFYRIVQGKSEKVQTFVLHLERALMLPNESMHKIFMLCIGLSDNISVKLCILYHF